MAQVPYDPVPSVGADAERIRRPEVEAPPAAFGVNIGQSMEGLAAQGRASANELFERAMWLQQLNNENTARDTSIAATRQMAEDWENFRATTTGSPEELDTFLRGLSTTRQQYRSTLNPVAGRMYDSEAASLQNRITMAAASRNSEVFRERTNASAAARIDQLTRTWVNPKDETEFNGKLEKIDKEIDNLGATSVPPLTTDQVADKKLKAHEALRTTQIGTIALTDVGAAFTALDEAKAKKEISDIEFQRVTKELRTENRSQGGQNVANAVWDPNISQKEMEERARNMAADPAINHGDPDFTNSALQAVVIKYSQEHQAIIHDQWTAKNQAEEAINTGKYRTEQEFRADPANNDAAKRAGPEFNVAKALREYWTPRDAEVSKGIREKLMGEAHDDPKAFLREDLWDQKLNNGDRGALMLRRKQILNGGQPDPNVTKAAEAISNIFQNSVPQKGTDAYHTFLGTLQGTLDDYEADAQRKLTRDDYEKIGRSILERQPGTGWFHRFREGDVGYGAERVFEATPPPEVMEHGRAQGWPDEKIVYDYHRALAIATINKLYGQPSATTK